MANSYLQRTLSSGNRKKFTVSAWVKRGKLGAQQIILNTQDDGSNQAGLQFLSGDTLNFYSAIGGTYYQLVTDKVFRDSTAFYHIVAHYDTTDSTQGDRIKLYVNGVRETSFSTATYPTQDYDTFWNQNKVHTIGAYNGASLFFEGYLSHVAFVDNAALTPTTFGETDSTSGIWKFKSPSGVTWGTNGFHLKFENSGALGTDSSGNSNTFTVNGNLKQALDTPSNVYSTMNPLDNYYFGGTFINGNNTATGSSSSYTYCTSTLGVNSGKWYVEAKLSAADSSGSRIGVVARPSTATTNGIGDRQDEIAFQTNGTLKLNSATTTSWGSTWTVGDIIGIALDLDNNKIYFSKNGTYQASGNPSTGANGQTITAASSTIDGFYRFGFGDNNSSGSSTFQYNFGNGFFGTTAITSAGSNGNGSLFEYDVPTGYYALNTKNINTYG